MFIHLLPALYMFIARWITNIEFQDMTFTYWWLAPICTWWGWQICYQIKTEFVDKLDDRPEIITSLTWLSGDSRNFMYKLTKQVCQQIGVMGPDEEFNSKEWKTKIVFSLANFVYFLVVVIPCPIFFYSFYAHTS